MSFGVYIHWPYCLSKCPYCDFFSRAVSPDATLIEAYQAEIQRLPKRTVTSVFFGGGTPSLMQEKDISALLEAVAVRCGLSPDAEISLEANPDAIDMPKMKALHALGVNRLSLGVQSLSDDSLQFLGRHHDAKTARLRIEQMARIFDNCSIDLMYALPFHTLSAWEKELAEALTYDLPHYSLYQLTIEEGTPFARQGVKPADENVARDLFLQTLEQMEKAGKPWYEVSNFAQKGFECRHNLGYWLGKDYAGIGPGAHGRYGCVATENPCSVPLWRQQGTQKTRLSKQERFEEKLLMGLRLRQGFSTRHLAPKAVQRAIDNGWVVRTKNKVVLTQEGLLMLNPLTVLLCP
ncbi:MAG: radical SAM family heme chaperone HemW [Alphaproteobacteria bacterium]|nr:radical SAM family heme chaperone HemW [Alphaproteobacteria bacterium]